MKVILQTNITPIMTVYDSSKPSDPNEKGGFSTKVLYKFLRPIIHVTDDRGFVLYKTGEFYQSYFRVFVLFAVVIGGYFIFRRLAR